jgi:hypothetical protein
MDSTNPWEDALTNLAVYICVAKSPAGVTNEEILDALNGKTPEELVETCIGWVRSMNTNKTKGDK